MPMDLQAFTAAATSARTADDVWTALQEFTRQQPGHILFTVMTVDMQAGLARRAFSSHPEEYPVSGTKPIERNSWFDIVHGERRSFVANTIEDIAKVFPDHPLIASLGCGSVFNLPVIAKGDLVATINMLDVAHHYSDERVRDAEARLALPGALCWALAECLDSQAKTPD